MSNAVMQTKCEQLEAYFGGIEENISGDPYAIAYGYILGTFLQSKDN